MILTLLFAATLAVPAEATPAAERAGFTTTTSPLEEQITLELKDASLKDTLEKLAVLMDATPIFEPGLEGITITLSVQNITVADLLRRINAEYGIQVSYVTKSRIVDGKPQSERRLIARSKPGTPLPTPPHAPTRAGGEAVTYGLRHDSGKWIAWRELGPWMAPVPLNNGCAPRLGLLRSDDGGRVVFLDGSGQPRIVSPRSEAFRLPGCDGAFTLQVAPQEVVAEAVRRPRPERFLTYVIRLLEVRGDSEEVLTSAKLMTAVGDAFHVRSGSAPSSAPDAPAARELSVRGLTLAAEGEEALLAISVTVDGELEPRRGMVRLTQSDQSLKLAFDRAERVTLSSTYGGGRSALVAELTVTRAAPNN